MTTDIPKETSGAVQRWRLEFDYGGSEEWVEADPGAAKTYYGGIWVKHEDCLQIEQLLQDRITDNQALRALVREHRMLYDELQHECQVLEAEVEDLRTAQEEM